MPGSPLPPIPPTPALRRHRDDIPENPPAPAAGQHSILRTGSAPELQPNSENRNALRR